MCARTNVTVSTQAFHKSDRSLKQNLLSFHFSFKLVVNNIDIKSKLEFQRSVGKHGKINFPRRLQ